MDSGAIAVVGSQVVAWTAIVAGFVQQRRSFNNERQLSDRESVRSLLSEAATLRHQLESTWNAAFASFCNEGAGLFGSAPLESPYRDFAEAIRGAEKLRGQMEIRLGPEDPVTVAFSDAIGASRSAEVQLSMTKMKIIFGGGWGGGEEAEEAFLGERRATMNSQREIFDTRAGEFVTLAHNAAGARLPTSNIKSELSA